MCIERLGKPNGKLDHVVAETGVERVSERFDSFAEQAQQQQRVAGRPAGLDPQRADVTNRAEPE